MKDLDFIDNLLDMDEEDLKQLAQKAIKMKTDILMEEDWEDFLPCIRGRRRRLGGFLAE